MIGSGFLLSCPRIVAEMFFGVLGSHDDPSIAGRPLLVCLGAFTDGALGHGGKPARIWRRTSRPTPPLGRKPISFRQPLRFCLSSRTEIFQPETPGRCVKSGMVATKQADRDPEYAKFVSAVLELHGQGLTYSEIAEQTDDMYSVVTPDSVRRAVVSYSTEPDAGAQKKDIERRATEDKALVMLAAGFKDYEVARALNRSPDNVRQIKERREADFDDVKKNWRTWSVQDGYAAREFRIRQLHDELLYFDEWLPEITWSYEKEHKGLGHYVAVATGEMVQRKYALDRYGRPIWTTLRLKLMDELAKLQGDHVSTINVNKLDDEQTKLVASLAAGHQRAIAPPQEPATDAEFQVTDAPATASV